MSLFIATGFSICGVSAIVAMSGTRRHEDEDVATAVALVTVCGSLAILVLPVLRGPLGLSQHEFGLWVGASVHDVGQVVATAGGVGSVALGTAVLVKLVRVLLLAPMVTAAAVTARRSARARLGPSAASGRTASCRFFIVGFLVMVAASGRSGSSRTACSTRPRRRVRCCSLRRCSASVRRSTCAPSR